MGYFVRLYVGFVLILGIMLKTEGINYPLKRIKSTSFVLFAAKTRDEKKLKHKTKIVSGKREKNFIVLSSKEK